MPAENLERLLAGNRRFAAANPQNTYDFSAVRASSLVASQHPFATVFGCADSRVPVEIIFDQGLGDLFVVRNAGHIVGDSVLGSMEFAVSKLGCRLIMVLGHSGCGAVTAAVHAGQSGTYPPGHLASIVKAIEPAVKESNTTDVDSVMRTHVIHTLRDIYDASGLIASKVNSGDLALVAAEYSLTTQLVDVLGIVDAARH